MNKLDYGYDNNQVFYYGWSYNFDRSYCRLSAQLVNARLRFNVTPVVSSLTVCWQL